MLGHPFLHSIGFNLEEHRTRFRHALHGKPVDKLDTETMKLAAASYKHLSYLDTNDDPIQLLECLFASIGKDSEDFINAAFSTIVEEARTNGI